MLKSYEVVLCEVCSPVRWLCILLYGFGGKAGGCFCVAGLMCVMSALSFGNGTGFTEGGVRSVSPDDCASENETTAGDDDVCGGSTFRLSVFLLMYEQPYL